MQVFIDDTRLDDAPDAPAAIELARDHVQGTDRLIIEVAADGKPAPDTLFDGSDDGAGLAELRFTTAATGAFLAESVHAAKDSLHALRERQKTAAEQIRAGEMTEALGTLGEVLEGWGALRDVVDQVAQLAGIDLASLATPSGTGADHIGDLSKALIEVRDTVESKDWASLGDTLAYDLDELIDRWSALLDALIERSRGA